MIDELLFYERCVAFGFYERTGVASNFCSPDRALTTPELLKYEGLPIGGYKHRLNQTAAAMGRVQLKYYDRRIAEINQAMSFFWDFLEGTPGIKPHRVLKDSGSTMADWFSPKGLYCSEELSGLSCAEFCEAVRAEGVQICIPGCNQPLHLHPVFHEADIFRMGKPTMISFGQRYFRQ